MDQTTDAATDDQIVPLGLGDGGSVLSRYVDVEETPDMIDRGAIENDTYQFHGLGWASIR